MAIYGIGAHYDGVDVTQDFIKNECACLNWDVQEAPALHDQIKHLKVGDVIYIKSFPPKIGLTIKAVGLVTDNNARQYSSDLGIGVPVKWVWQGNDIIKFSDKYNVHMNTLYEEHVPEVQKFVLSKF